MRKWAWPLFGLIGALLFLWLSPIAEPEAQVDLNVTRQQAIALSRDFLNTRGFDVTGYDSAVVFGARGFDSIYLQKTFGLDASNRLAKEYKVWHWTVRWYKPLSQTGYTVDVDSAAPAVLGFSRTLPDAEPGAHLTQEQARGAAERLLADRGYRLADWLDVGSTTQERRARTDYQFSWQRRGVLVGQAHPKVDVAVQGDKAAALEAYLQVPDAFQREWDRSKSVGTGLAMLSGFLMFVMMTASLIYAIRLSRQGQAAWRLGIWSAVLIAGSAVLSSINLLPQMKTVMPTAVPVLVTYAGAVLVAVLTAAFSGGLVLFPAAAGEGIAAQDGHPGSPFFARFRRGKILTPGFGASAFRGLCLAGVMLGYDVLFYYVGRKYLGVWSPSGPRYDNILATPFPWLYPLSASLMAAFWEEYLFRLFGVSLARRLVKWLPAALLIPAVIWAFGHSTYDVFPVWTRGVELTIFGAFLGWVYWQYDIETTIIAHYSYDALLIAWPLLRSGNPYYIASGAVVSGLALIPALLGWIGARRGLPEAPADPVAAPPAPAHPAAPPAAPPAPDLGGGGRLDRLVHTLRSRPALWAAAALVGLAVTGANSLLRPPSLLREYTVSATAAVATARQYLAGQGFDLTGYSVTRAMRSAPFAGYTADVAGKRALELARNYHGVGWAVRFYKPLEPITYLVTVDARTGQVFGLQRTLPPDAPGESLTQEGARQMAIRFLSSAGYDPAGLPLATDSTLHRDRRVDYVFAWEGKDPRVADARVRSAVTVQGGMVGDWQAPTIVPPEEWARRQEAKSGWLVLGGGAVAIGGLIWLVMALIYAGRGQASLRPLRSVVVIALLCGAGMIVSGWSGRAMSYDTTTVWSTFATIQLTLSAMMLLGPAFGLAAMWAVARVVARRLPAALPWRRIAGVALGTAAVGLATGGLIGAVAHWAGLVQPDAPAAAEGYLGIFRLLTIPAVALGAELFLRVWLQSLLSRWLRSQTAGLLAHAVLLAVLVGVLVGWPMGPFAGFAALLDALLFGLAYLAGGLPTVVVARALLLLVQHALPLLGAGLCESVATGAASLAAAALVLAGVHVYGRRQTQAPPV